MGFFWDLMQQSQISDQQELASSLEGRVERLEENLRRTNHLLQRLLERLEKQLGEDINRDGRIG
jgi:chaperonin cofactor prefoldin